MALRLYYFPLRARADSLRQLMKLAGAEFEDILVPLSEWHTLKKTTPFGQLPVLQIGDEKLAQSMAIARYIGYRFGLSPESPLDAARLDMMVDLIKETDSFMQNWSQVCLGFKPCPNKSEYYRENVRPKMEKYAGFFEQFLAERDSKFLIGDQAYWGDIVVAEFFKKFVDFGEPNALDNFPKIRGFIEQVESIPAIKQHIKDRKATPF